MKAYIASDLHWDDWAFDCKTAENYINGWDIPLSKNITGKEVHPGLLRKEECIIVAGDIANNYETWCQMVKALANNYKEVVLVLGNHDLTVDWGDTARFANTEEKVEAYKKFVKYYPNVHLLDGDVVKIGDTTIGGCMGMWDLAFIKNTGYRRFYSEDASAWREVNKKWKYWFDCKHWNYMNNRVDDIRAFELSKIDKCLAQKPDIMVTHFCPFPGEGMIPWEYRRNTASSFFYFDPKYTNDVKYWIAGHTHTPYFKVGYNKNIIVNPIGYFAENDEKNMVKDEWVIDV